MCEMFITLSCNVNHLFVVFDLVCLRAFGDARSFLTVTSSGFETRFKHLLRTLPPENASEFITTNAKFCSVFFMSNQLSTSY